MDDNQPTQSTDDNEAVLPSIQQPQDQPLSVPPPMSGSDDVSSPDQTVPDSRALIQIPDEAGDSDLIEKEWVLKAKQIVDHTSEDPFTQQQELSKMKADYLKKRYNRDLGAA